MKLIPFDSDIEMTVELSDAYGAALVTPDPKWDEIGQALYGTEEYRPGIPAWRYFRKLNVFDGSSEPLLFVDSNVVLLNDLSPAWRALEHFDLVFGGRAKPNRNFVPWASYLLNMLDPNVKDGFNACLWITRGDLFNQLDLAALSKYSAVRAMFGDAPEQSFMQLAALFLKKRIGALGEIDETLHPTLWAEIAPKLVAEALRKNITREGRIPLTIKWAGRSFHGKAPIRSKSVYRPLFEGVLQRIKGRRKLVATLCKQYEISLAESLAKPV